MTPDEWVCLSARSGIGKLKTVCERHVNEFLGFYQLRQKHCCDPLNKHKTAKVIGARFITVSEYRTSKSARQILNQPLIPGQKLCKRCATEVLPMLEGFPPAVDTPSSGASSQSEPHRSQGEANTNQVTLLSAYLSCNIYFFFIIFTMLFLLTFVTRICHYHPVEKSSQIKKLLSIL